MTNERKNEIKIEAKRRLNEWIKNSSFEEMTVGGSYIRFDIGLGLRGYPFQKEEWMKDDDFNRFLTDDEFYSQDYDEIVHDVFELAKSQPYK